MSEDKPGLYTVGHLMNYVPKDGMPITLIWGGRYCFSSDKWFKPDSDFLYLCGELGEW